MKQNTQTNNLFLRITGLFVILLMIASVTGLTLPRVFTAQAVTPPNIISYQGRILNSNSVPVADASATMIFELYDASTGGTCLWSNSSATCATATGKTITLTDGLFSENLGDTGASYAAIADSVFADNGGVYLQVTIGGETLTPRKQISAAPYALNADTVDGIDSTGLMLSTGDTATGSYDFTGAELLGASSLQFEGVTDDDVYTTFAFTDPTVARTITFKDESGTVAFLSDVGGTSLFTDGGTTTYLTSTTDDLAIGATDPTASPFGVDESANTVYIGEGSTANGNIIFKASDADTGTLTYNTSDTFAFTGGAISSDSTITAVDFACTDCLDFTELSDSLALDAATTIALGSNSFDINLNSSGDFAIQDAGTDIFSITSDSSVLFARTRTSGAGAIAGYSFDYTDSSSVINSILVDIDNLDDGGATGGPQSLLRLDNSDLNEAVLYGIRVESAFDGGITDAFNASSFQIDNALNAGNNFILYTGIRQATLGSGVLTWEDTAGNDLMTLTDSGTTGTLNVTGDLTCADCFDWSDWADGTSTLDATTNTSLGASTYNWLLDGAGDVAFNMSSTGNFSLRDSGFSFFSVNAAREIDYVSDGTTGDAWDFSDSTLTTGTFFDIDAGNGSMTANVIDISNTGTGSSIFIDQNGNTGLTVDDTAGGALHLTNTGNDDFGLSIYTNNGATAATPLVYLVQDNTAFDQNVLTIQNDSTAVDGKAIRIDQNGGGSSEVIDISANTAANVLKIVNTGNLDTRQGISIQGCLDTNPTSSCNWISFFDGNGTPLGAIEGDGAGGVTNASTGSDYAELFPGNLSAFSTGDIVALDAAGNVTLASSARQLIGAFSIAPNTLGNWFEDWQTVGTHVPVALLGQVPVSVNMEGGPIAVGDNLTISSVNGVATKATGVGYMLGTALESTSVNGQIMVFVQPKWHALDIFVDNGDTTLVSEGLVLGQTATATAGNLGTSSHSLSFKGSTWTGASAVGREMFVQNDVTDGDNYRLSIKNNDETEVAFINNEGDLSLSGKLYPSDRGVAQTDKYIFYDGSTGFGGDFMRTNASGWGSGSYDFAEMFPSQDHLVAGEVVVFAEGSAEVARSTSRHYDPKIAGIISTQPGFLAGNNIEGHVPVALTGRVPTYVTTENGVIKSGDPLTTSSRPGYAMKAATEGQIVGYAMEGFSGNTGVITVFVRPSYYDGSTIVDAPAANNTISGLQGSISDFDVTGVLNMNGGSIINVASLSGISGIWELKHDGEFRTKGRFVHLVVSSQGELVETYPTLSTQTTIELTGTAQLTNGRARIIFEDIDPVFNDIIAPAAPYRVFLTADSPTNPIYAIERDNDGFVIRETNGSSNATVDWMVIAYHKDFAPTDDTSIQGQDTGVTEPTNEPVENPVIEPEAVIEEPIVDPVIVEEQPVEPLPETTPDLEVVEQDPLPEPVVEEPIVEEPPIEISPEVVDETAV